MNTLLDLLKPIPFKRETRGVETMDGNTFVLYHVKKKTHYLYFGKNSPFYNTYKSAGIYEMENELFIVGFADLSGDLKISNPSRGTRINSTKLVAFLIKRFSLRYTNNDTIHQLFTITKIADRIYKITKQI